MAPTTPVVANTASPSEVGSVLTCTPPILQNASQSARACSNTRGQMEPLRRRTAANARPSPVALAICKSTISTGKVPSAFKLCAKPKATEDTTAASNTPLGNNACSSTPRKKPSSAKPTNSTSAAKPANMPADTGLNPSVSENNVNRNGTASKGKCCGRGNVAN